MNDWLQNQVEQDLRAWYAQPEPTYDEPEPIPFGQGTEDGPKLVV